MFPMGSLDEFRNFYTENGGFNGGGIWSFLLTQSAEESADFARRYYDVFNDISQGNWHLVIFSRAQVNKGKVNWVTDSNLQEFGNIIRASLEESGQKVPPRCIVFFDPEAGDASDRSCLLIPLDWSKISNIRFFSDAFISTHRIVMDSFEEVGVSAYEKIPSHKVADLIINIKNGLWKMKVISHFKTLTFALGNAIFGALVGKAM